MDSLTHWSIVAVVQQVDRSLRRVAVGVKVERMDVARVVALLDERAYVGKSWVRMMRWWHGEGTDVRYGCGPEV